MLSCTSFRLHVRHGARARGRVWVVVVREAARSRTAAHEPCGALMQQLQVLQCALLQLLVDIHDGVTRAPGQTAAPTASHTVAGPMCVRV